PNAKFISETITNWSFRSNRIRVKVPIGVASNSNPRQVEEALLAAAARSQNVFSEPPPAVFFRAFGEYTLNFQLLCWTSVMLHKTPSFESEMNHLIWDELTRRGIEIPNPQRDLHIRSAEGLEPLLSPGVGEGRARRRGMERAKSSMREAQP